VKRLTLVTLLPFLASLAVVTACATHIAPYKAKHRQFNHGEYGSRSGATEGSLYAGGPGLYDDTSAARVGDIVVIKIDEKDTASHAANTKLNRADDTNYGVPNMVGFVAALKAKYPDVDPAKLFSTTSSQKFSGEGAVTREGVVTATLPVRVAEVMPNGDLYVEGTKVVMVGDEEHHIYMSGLVRKLDLADDSSVLSSRIADAEIEYTGRGDISDTQRRGWLARLASKIWPF
jgi:flagellar L-ring protein precursor FlgH